MSDPATLEQIGSELDSVKRLLGIKGTHSAPLVQKAYNRIFWGAPGTGKSHELEMERMEFFSEPECYERVTFYPNYSFAQFVGTYKPIMKEALSPEDPSAPAKKSIAYSYVPGPFIRIYVKAKLHPEKNYLLVIEEINRANAPAVFGDMFQLLDRIGNGYSEYPVATSEDLRAFLEESNIDTPETICLPSNLYIWATMNSADQGVFPLDTAFKRRWDYRYFGINNCEQEIAEKSFSVAGKSYNWNEFRKAINNKLLERNINEDKLLGPFFIKPSLFDNNELAVNAIKSKVLMYLYEDAGRQYRNSGLFDKCNVSGHVTYSDICDSFDKYGGGIFGVEGHSVEDDATLTSDNSSNTEKV